MLFPTASEDQTYTELKAHFSHLQPVSPVTTLEVLQESVPEVQPGAALGRLPPSPYERQPWVLLPTVTQLEASSPTPRTAFSVQDECTHRVVRPWHRCPREVVDSSSLKVIKARLDEAWSTLG